MVKESFQMFSDLQSETSLANGNHRKGGCYVTIATGFILTFLAVAIAVGIGIIVHFAGPARTFECNCSYPDSNNPGGTGEQQQTTKHPVTPSPDQCRDWAAEGSHGICDVCTSDTTTSKPPTSATTAPPTIQDVRLPLALEPILYTVELKPNMYDGDPKAFNFEGFTNIRMLCKEPTNKVTVHINKLEISTGTLKFTPEAGSAPSYVSHEFDTDRQFLVVHLDANMVVGSYYNLEMKFVGPLKDDLHGLYLSQYPRGNQTIYIATTQFQPTDARKAFPCFDEPAIKAKFDITLVRKQHMKSLSNMPIKRTDIRPEDGFIADVFDTTEKMSTYLLAFIICDFDYMEANTTNGIRYRTWARPEAINQVPYSLEAGTEMLTYFEGYFGVKFPLPKQDMIAIPDFSAGAMENWGLITYRETAMLYEPGVSSEGNKQRVSVVVSHELAHQWFGNLVTPSWWDDLWLNEGFASFVEYMGVDFKHPDWKMFEQFVTEDLQDVMDFDSLVTSHPVYVPVNHPDEINEIFDRISYAKGASIIRMMRFFLGEETFRKGLRNYLVNKSYQAAFHDDLWSALTDQSAAEGKNLKVKDIMDTWTLQMNYPTVKVTVPEAGRVRLSQTRYLRDPSATDTGKYPSPFNYKWEIPFTFTTSKDITFNQTDEDVVWLSKNGDSLEFLSDSIPSPGGVNWVLGNVMQYGYYRVNYDDNNWLALIDVLKTNHKMIHPINRAQIINDAWNLAKSGELKMEIALQTVEYLDKERDFVPWEAAGGELSYVGTMLQRQPLYGAFKTFMKSKTESPFAEVGMNNTGAAHLESFMRSTFASMACDYGIRECEVKASELFATWKADPNNNPIDPGLKSTVYCTAIANGGIDEWEFAFTQYTDANLAAEKSRLLGALSCSKETWILSRYLQYSIDPSKIRKQDAVSVISSIASNPIGRALAWDFVRAKWDFLMGDFQMSPLSRPALVRRVTASFNTVHALSQLEQHIEKHPALGTATRAFQQAIEKTKSNIQWMDKNYEQIEKWLNSQDIS